MAKKTKETQEEGLFTEGEEVVGTTNEIQLSKREEIAARAEAGISKEFETPPEDDLTPEVPESEEHEIDPSPEPIKAVEIDPNTPITRKVNGVEVTKTYDQWLNTASKVAAADQYLAQAAEVYRSTQQPSREDAVPVDKDWRAIARTIQMGSEEEAAEILQRQFMPPSIDQDEIINRAVDKFTAKSAAERFKEENKDLFGDEFISQMVTLRDNQLAESGFSGPYTERWKMAAQDVRTALSRYKPSTLEEKQLRKASVTTIPTAHARAVAPVDNEQEESPSAIIAQMAKARGQG